MYTTADVTVYIVCCGQDPLLRCFDGLLAQTADPARIIVIDNGCWPGIALENHIVRHVSCPVDVLRLDKPLPMAAVRNYVLELCNTPLLLGLDSHVIPSPDWLQLMTDAIAPRCHCMAEKAERVCGVGGCVDYLNPEKGHESAPRNLGGQALENPSCLWSGNAIFKTEALREIGGYPAEAADGEEDLALAERLRQNGGVLLYVPGIRCGEV